MNDKPSPIASQILATYPRPVKEPKRFNRNGRHLNLPLTKEQLIQRFLWFIEPQENGCWKWTGGFLRNGYGQVRIAKKTRLTHRVSYELFIGPIPEGICVCHKCDNRWCVRPDCFFLGTRHENMGDCAKKGRSSHGSAHPNAVFSELDVLQIRAAHSAGGVTHKGLAKEYGVHLITIGRILRRERWKHI